jgi:hypothetical protein
VRVACRVRVVMLNDDDIIDTVDLLLLGKKHYWHMAETTSTCLDCGVLRFLVGRLPSMASQGPCCGQMRHCWTYGIEHAQQDIEFCTRCFGDRDKVGDPDFCNPLEVQQDGFA